MNRNNCEINILIKGRKASEYQSPMDFQTYVEGRDGSEFEIEFINRNSFDVEAILSVDGLSVTDGKPAGSDSSGYMVPANGTVRVPGWTLDKSQVAKFFFAGAKGGSYAEQSGQDARNKGVIGAKVYARKQTYRNPPLGVFRTAGVKLGGPTAGGYVHTGSASLGSWSDAHGWNNAVMGSASMSPITGGGTRSMTGVTLSNSMVEPQSFNAVSPADDLTATPEIEQTLGTGFGDASNFQTQSVDFERGDMIALMEVFYDDAQGLKRRGIDVKRPAAARPSAFPADEPKGCVPPPNWQSGR